MAPQLTIQQRIFIVEQWLKNDKNSVAITAAFAKEFPNDIPPSRQSMLALANKFHETGSVTDKKRSGRPKTRNNNENKENFMTLYQEIPSISAVCASLQLRMPRTSLRRILTYVVGYVNPSGEESSCVLIQKENILKIRCNCYLEFITVQLLN